MLTFHNVGTVKAIHDAFVEGKPLVERIITISGEKVQIDIKYVPNESVLFGLKDRKWNVNTLVDNFYKDNC